MQQRRNVLLVNKRFQIKYSFYVVSWILALSLVYPLITNNLFEFFLSYSKMHSPPSSVAILENVQKEFVQLLVLLHVVFICVIFLISLFMSHKIAGPLYKLRRFFELAKEGDFTKQCSFRKSDHFQELSEDYNELMGSIRNKFTKNRESISKAVGLIESELKKGSNSQLEDALTELRKTTE